MKKRYNFWVILIFIALIVLCIYYSENIKNAVITAIKISGNSIIPSLLPTMYIISIMINSGIIFSINKKLVPIVLFVLSQISGYPIGAKILNLAVKNEIVNKKCAQKLLPSMVCSGPAFVISFVGYSIFGSEEIGFRIYFSLILSNLLLFIALGGLKTEVKEIYTKTEFKKVILNSVYSSADSVFKISILFVFFYAFVKGFSFLFSEKINLIISLILEVISCTVVSKNIYLTCAALSWGGICVYMQIKTFCENIDISFFRYCILRITSLTFACLILKLSFIISPVQTEVFSNVNEVP